MILQSSSSGNRPWERNSPVFDGWVTMPMTEWSGAISAGRLRYELSFSLPSTGISERVNEGADIMTDASSGADSRPTKGWCDGGLCGFPSRINVPPKEFQGTKIGSETSPMAKSRIGESTSGMRLVVPMPHGRRPPCPNIPVTTTLSGALWHQARKTRNLTMYRSTRCGYSWGR